MPNLSIKDVPEGIAEALRQRAARNHRSLQGELMAIITAAAERPAGAEAAPPLQGWRRGTRTIEELTEERRSRYPEPVRGGPLGVDIIREDRDSR
jgi:antitoxin FitA